MRYDQHAGLFGESAMVKWVAVSLLLVFFAAAAACNMDIPVDDTILEQESLYSQNKEEVIIRHFFQDAADGFFVDIGSYQWKAASTTYYLEEHLGWSGIAVDAQEQYRAGYEKNRPNTKFFSFFVSDQSNLKQPFFLAGPVSSHSEEHVKLFPRFAEATDELTEIEVETITLDDLLAGNNVSEIDFLSVDVEGVERKVLDGFSIGKYKPGLVCVSAGIDVREEVLDYFEINDYEVINQYEAYDHVNLFFRPSD